MILIIDLAYEMFRLQFFSKKYLDNFDKIQNRVLRFLPAHLKLQNTTITQQDCLEYLKNNNTHKFVLLDVPYIGSEYTYVVKEYSYKAFHQKVAEFLYTANYSFLYHCRNTPPKSDTTFTKEQGEHIMKMKLAQYFMNKGYYFQKVHLKENTELMISNQLYNSKNQFQWTSLDQSLI